MPRKYLIKIVMGGDSTSIITDRYIGGVDNNTLCTTIEDCNKFDTEQEVFEVLEQVKKSRLFEMIGNSRNATVEAIIMVEVEVTRTQWVDADHLVNAIRDMGNI